MSEITTECGTGGAIPAGATLVSEVGLPELSE